MNNQMVTIPKCASNAILEYIDVASLENGFIGNVSNLYANHLNDFGNVNSDIAEYIDDNKEHLDRADIALLLDNPDYIIQMASDAMYKALYDLWSQWGSWSAPSNADKAQYTMTKANKKFDAWGNYYLFVNADCACQYLIRSDNEATALDCLLWAFESAFSIDESDVNEDTIYNENGTPCNIDYLTLIGTINVNN